MSAKFQNKYRIESNRWRFWDYSAPGSYFITICIVGMKRILGRVINNKMELSEYGEFVKTEFLKMPDYNKRAILDEWVVMPNHVHCIITLGDYVEKIHEFSEPVVEKIHEFSLSPTENEIKQYRKQRRKMLIPKILGKFQQQTSKQMNILRNTPGRKNWQPNYHDHVIRNDEEYNRIKRYIINNPRNWGNDKFYNNDK